MNATAATQATTTSRLNDQIKATIEALEAQGITWCDILDGMSNLAVERGLPGLAEVLDNAANEIWAADK